MKNKTLSDDWTWSNSEDYQHSSKAIKVYPETKVKEFIRLLKEDLKFLREGSYNYLECLRLINKLSGEKLNDK